LKARGIAFLLAEQNLAFASQIADGYTVLSHGYGVAAGSKDELKDQERIFAAYLGANM
jgi:ABC-type branched-subunit amino acid transport system ATPase component